jgi:uncharacterized protein
MMPGSVNKCFLLLIFYSIAIATSAQTSMFRSDIEHINIQLSHSSRDSYKRPYIYTKDQSFIEKINPIGLLAGGSLYIYQNVLSKHISADCLFTPSCSEFSRQAIKEYGLLKGIILTADRLNRCNRIAAQDLRYYKTDPKTNRYPDPVSRYGEASNGKKE